MESYDFEEERIVKEIKERKSKKILLQLPEGLKKESFKIVDLIQDKTEADVLVSGSTCWGGCDIAVNEAKKLKCDLIIQFGHAKFISNDFPVLYIELYSKQDIVKVLDKKIDELKINKIGLIGSVQYLKQFENVKEYLESKGKEVTIPKKKGFAAYDGHVVGCEYNCLKPIEDEIDGVLVLGNKFHSLGAALMIFKPVYLLDEQNGELYLMNEERDKMIKQRAISIDKIKQANKIGILVDTKLGQYNIKIAEKLKENLEKINKKVMIIIVKEFTPDLMNFYDVEGFIDTACPRIAVEDYDKYERPMITSREAKVVTGEVTWKGLLEKGFIGFI